MEEVSMRRKTLGRSITVNGLGLHTGEQAAVTLHPADAGEGIVFFVRNRQGVAHIPALAPFVTDTRRRVVLAKDGVWVQTVEHLLAACFGMGITDLLVEVDGNELPIGDGSAQLWVDAF
ncbi:MAG: UDP-3-O-acyl-N-acetylglucosamine deacetylase, partial [Armatimonadota bacterium]